MEVVDAGIDIYKRAFNMTPDKENEMDPMDTFYDFSFPSNGSNFSIADFDLQGVLDSMKDQFLTVNETNTIVLLCLYAPVFILSIIGNVTVLLVIIPNRRMWSITNNFLLNLAISDLLVTLVCIPMTVAERIYRLWIYGEIMCKLTPYLQVVSVTASTLTITTMSLDRCLAIRHPMKFRNFRTTTIARIVIMLIWVVSILLALPLLIIRVTVSEEILLGESLIFCTESWESMFSRKVYDIALLLLMCIFPAVTITICYILMGKRLWLPDRKLSDDGRCVIRTNRNNNERERSQRNITLNRRRLAKLCIVIAVVFILCWMPYFVVNTYVDFFPDKDLVDLSSFILLVGHVHCVTNPILYCFLHKTFRHYVLRCIVSRIKSKPTAKYGQGYLTFYRTTPYKSHPRSSIKSATSHTRRQSSSYSADHRANETNGRLCNGGHGIEHQKRIVVNIVSNPTETICLSAHSHTLSIPSSIDEETKLYNNGMCLLNEKYSDPAHNDMHSAA